MQNSNNKKLFKVYRSPIQGRGLLALTDIPKETRIIEYVGEKITKAEAIRRIEKRGSKAPILVFELNQRYDIDGNVPGNPGKYINHSCEANCEAENARGRIWISAKKDIKKGEELTYDYGFDMDCFWDHPCCCGSSNCVGYIVRSDLRSRVRRMVKNRKSKKQPLKKS